MNLELFNDPPGSGPIHFYEIRHYWLSNFSSFAVRYCGELYPTSEHAYQAEKFPKDSPLRMSVATAPSAYEAMRLARLNQHSVLPEWDDVKRDVMKAIVRQKLYQHDYIQRKLRDTAAHGHGRPGRSQPQGLRRQARASVTIRSPRSPNTAMSHENAQLVSLCKEDTATLSTIVDRLDAIVNLLQITSALLIAQSPDVVVTCQSCKNKTAIHRDARAFNCLTCHADILLRK